MYIASDGARKSGFYLHHRWCLCSHIEYMAVGSNLEYFGGETSSAHGKRVSNSLSCLTGCHGLSFSCLIPCEWCHKAMHGYQTCDPNTVKAMCGVMVAW